MANLEKRMMRKLKRYYQCAICGEKESRPHVCCGHPMIELKPHWDLLDWDILAWKKRQRSGRMGPERFREML